MFENMHRLFGMVGDKDMEWFRKYYVDHAMGSKHQLTDPLLYPRLDSVITKS